MLDSCTNYKEYVELAVRDGMKALSISEHGKPLQWTEKWNACKQADIKYIHSVEIYLTESLEEKVRDNYHTVLLAKNMDGLRELNALVSKSTDKDHFYYTNRISFEEFLNMSDNIMSTSACLASPLNKLPDDHPMYEKLARKYTFLEIQPHSHPDQVAFNKRLYALSKRIGTPLIAGTDTHSSSDYKAECRQILLEAKHKSYGDEDAFDLTYKTYDELVAAFRRQGALPEEVFLEAIENTNRLADMAEEIDLDLSIKYPILHGSAEADKQEFLDTIDRKLEEKLRNEIIPPKQEQAFRDAIQEEIRVFKKLDMCGFMLSMSELICWCKEHEMAIGPARGSVGGSRVAYVMDIIDLNPETWHTVFSRFTNEYRLEVGDIDVDCVESDRPAIFQHIVERFGREKTARVASFGTLQNKGVLDEVGRALAARWAKLHPDRDDNPWSLKRIARIKSEINSADELSKKENKPIWEYEDFKKAEKAYPQLFYYFRGLVGTKISQSVHPAGMVISPITLSDNYGTFDKDGEICLMLDMDNIHDFTGLVKYDLLILKTVQVIRDTCRYLGKPYPKTHEINWDDQEVWADMIKSPAGIFQFEKSFAFDSLKKFKPKSIFDMSLVTACIRPSGASYRDDLLAGKKHKNPSKMIDDLLERNGGYLIYQEDIIAFLQQICGLSGGDADNVRRAIGRKQKDRLDKAMPSILEGYCAKSDQPREIAEAEAREFLQIIEDASSYMFGYNHSIAYCLLGYLCAYYRHYHPLEFLTSYLNNAANEEDIQVGTAYANKVGIKITMPKWGFSKGDYSFDPEKRVIAKGLSSVKYIGASVAEELYSFARAGNYTHFMDVLADLQKTSVDTRQLEILIKIDFFSQLGNQRELLRIMELFYDVFKRGQAKQIAKSKVDNSPLGDIIRKYSVGVTKAGGEAKSYTLLDIHSILIEAEEAILALHMEDLSDTLKVRNFAEVMGYAGYVSGKQSDRPKLYIQEIYPVCRKKDGKQFGYSVLTKSIGSGIESRFTVFNRVYESAPIQKGDIIYCRGYERDGAYYQLTRYEKIIT